MNKKTIIHEFDPQIYPRMLWVVKGGNYEDLKERFEFAELDEDSKSGGAVTVSAYDNEKQRGGFLIWFPKAGDIRNGDWIAHEAAHVALGIFDYIGAEAKASDSEPFSYLVGWVFKCVDEVRKYKEVKDGNKEEVGSLEESNSETTTH